MTTNQTIDGVLVSRELLESMASYVADSPNAIMRSRAKQARALLEAPTCKTPSGAACPGDGVGPCKKCPDAHTQGKPVALLSKGFTTLETSDGKYRIITQYKNRDDAWSDYTALCKAEQPAPVAVMLPERLQQALKFLDGAENLDGH